MRSNHLVTAMLACFAASLPLIALELIRPGLVTQFLPLHTFAAPLILIIPAAFARYE